MPVKPCNSGDKPGYKWGDKGKCYTYTPGDEASRKRAKRKAHEQGMAIKANAERLLARLRREKKEERK